MPYKDNIFTVNWRRFARMFTPVELRRPKLMAMLYAMLTPVAELHASFISFRANVQYRLGINYQVCHLEKLLNDAFDVDQRRIWIETAPQQFLPIVLYTKAEGIPVKMYTKAEAEPVKMYVKQETPAGALGFIIYIHVDIVYNETELIQMVKLYALQTKTFRVQQYA